MKYMGSKRRIANDIIAILEPHLKNRQFVDLFCGGCNLIDKVNHPVRIANDNNKYLIAMWKGLQQDLPRPYLIPKELYSRARDEYNNQTNNEFTDFEIGWIGWMGSYNGRFFDGGYSGHNVKGRDYISEQIRNTEEQITNLADVKFYNLDYKNITITKPSVVYCDIPYKDVKQYASSKNFNHEEFWQWCRNIPKHSKIFISEYSAPDDFKCVWQKEVTNSLNTKKTYKPTERLFTLWDGTQI